MEMKERKRMEMDLEIDELLQHKFSRTKENSAILLTLSSKLNYSEAKIVAMYKNWKKI